MFIHQVRALWVLFALVLFSCSREGNSNAQPPSPGLSSGEGDPFAVWPQLAPVHCSNFMQPAYSSIPFSEVSGAMVKTVHADLNGDGEPETIELRENDGQWFVTSPSHHSVVEVMRPHLYRLEVDLTLGEPLLLTDNEVLTLDHNGQFIHRGKIEPGLLNLVFVADPKTNRWKMKMESEGNFGIAPLPSGICTPAITTYRMDAHDTEEKFFYSELHVGDKDIVVAYTLGQRIEAHPLGFGFLDSTALADRIEHRFTSVRCGAIDRSIVHVVGKSEQQSLRLISQETLLTGEDPLLCENPSYQSRTTDEGGEIHLLVGRSAIGVASNERWDSFPIGFAHNLYAIETWKLDQDPTTTHFALKQADGKYNSSVDLLEVSAHSATMAEQHLFGHDFEFDTSGKLKTSAYESCGDVESTYRVNTAPLRIQVEVAGECP